MAKLTRFMDHDRRGRWANLVMDNGDPCWIGIAQTGVLVKKSRVGLFGAKLYEQKNLYEAAKTAQALDSLYPQKLTPPEMWNPVLVAFANAVLHCRDLGEVTRVLNEAVELEQVASATLNSSSDRDLLEAQELVNRYGAILENEKNVTASKADLPAPKQQIKDALVALARHAKASGASRESIEPLRVGYASLAGFVSASDAKLATSFENLFKVPAGELDDATLRELAEKISDSGAGALDVTRRTTEEFARLTAEFDERILE